MPQKVKVVVIRSYDHEKKVVETGFPVTEEFKHYRRSHQEYITPDEIKDNLSVDRALAFKELIENLTTLTKIPDNLYRGNISADVFDNYKKAGDAILNSFITLMGEYHDYLKGDSEEEKECPTDCPSYDECHYDGKNENTIDKLRYPNESNKNDSVLSDYDSNINHDNEINDKYSHDCCSECDDECKFCVECPLPDICEDAEDIITTLREITHFSPSFEIDCDGDYTVNIPFTKEQFMTIKEIINEYLSDDENDEVDDVCHDDCGTCKCHCGCE